MPPKKSKLPKNTLKPSKPWDWSPVEPLDVIVVTKERQLTIGGEPVTEVQLKNLQAEVKALKTFHLWRIMQETVKNRAVESGFIKAENWEQTMSGKMMLHNLGILRSIVEVLESVPPLHTPPAPPRPVKHEPKAL